MRITITADGFTREIRHARQTHLRLHESAWGAVRAVSRMTADTVRVRMPVDSGQARASWANPDHPDGVWIELPRQLTIIQGSQISYIRYLNEGSSHQAPAGFIDAAERAAVDDLAQKFGEGNSP
jgi:hypothetical protein